MRDRLIGRRAIGLMAAVAGPYHRWQAAAQPVHRIGADLFCCLPCDLGTGLKILPLDPDFGAGIGIGVHALLGKTFGDLASVVHQDPPRGLGRLGGEDPPPCHHFAEAEERLFLLTHQGQSGLNLLVGDHRATGM